MTKMAGLQSFIAHWCLRLVPHRQPMSMWELLYVSGLTCFMAVLYILSFPLLEHIELKLFDLHFHWRGEVSPSGQVAFVTIDEESVNREGRWPWPRRLMGELLKAADENGAAVIGLDLGFFEPAANERRKAVQEIREALAKEHASEELLNRLDAIGADEDEDGALAETIKGMSSPLVLGHFFYNEGSDFVPEPPPSSLLDKATCKVVMSRGDTPKGKLREQAGLECNIPPIAESAEYSGSFNLYPDPDGTVRWMPLVFRYQERIFPSLALQMISAATGLPHIVKLHEGGIEDIRVGPVSIPTNGRGELLLNYYGPGYTFPHYSAAALMRGELPGESLKGKLVVIGITSMGLHDMRPTPFDPVSPGVEIHCTILENILQQQFLKRPETATPVYDIGALVGICAIFFLAQLFARGFLLAGIAGALAVGYPVLTQYLFVSKGLWLNNIYPLAGIAFAYTGTTMHRYIHEEREKRKVRQTFSLYVPHSVMDEMLAHPERLRLGGEKKELSILFSDIRGFTSLSEQLPADLLVPQLNEYMTRMTEVVFGQQGTLDKYIGDAVMAFFGAPLAQEDHALRACSTALEMMKALRVLQEEWKDEKMPVFEIGIGINSGLTMVGNMGSERRFNYTVIGDNVNLASRLEGLTKQYGVSIVISEATRNAVKNEFTTRELDLVRVKGKQEHVAIYELLCRRGEEGEKAEALELYAEALELFRGQRWREALDTFNRAEELLPGDLPTLLYKGRCMRLANEAPREGWSCITTLNEK